MPRKNNQKMKLTYLRDIFYYNTDEEHPLSLKELTAQLAANGIESERKSLYDDLEALRTYGMDIVQTGGGGNTKYYLASREFELPELQLLADAVACSKFITEKKSSQLIKKIEKLTSVYQARALDRNVIVANRVKAINERIYYNIQYIHEAIEKNVQITFRYFDYSMSKKPQYRRDKELYTLSPYSLAWENENYYCVGFYDRRGKITNFRVDCMDSISVTDEPRICEEQFDVTAYNRKVFDMFGGDTVRATLVFDRSLVRAVMDKFGANVRIRKRTEDIFEISVDITKSPTFLSWIFQFGEKARIAAPESLKEYMREYIEKAAANLARTEDNAVEN